MAAHLARVGEAGQRRLDVLGLGGAGAGFQPGGAFPDAQALEKRALAGRAMHLGAAFPGRAGELGEVDVGAKIGAAGGLQHGVAVVADDRLQGVAGPAFVAAIVDDQGAAAALATWGQQALSQVAGKVDRGRRDLGHAAQRRPLHGLRDQGLGRRGLGGAHEAQPAVRSQADQAFAPALDGALELADGQGVEKLVGHHDGRPRRHLVEVLVPAHLVVRQRSPLKSAQHRAGFH